MPFQTTDDLKPRTMVTTDFDRYNLLVLFSLFSKNHKWSQVCKFDSDSAIVFSDRIKSDQD